LEGGKRETRDGSLPFQIIHTTYSPLKPLRLAPQPAADFALEIDKVAARNFLISPDK
jgi:hypothetical protein